MYPFALEVALSIKAGTVWVNGHNMFDAASGFGGLPREGFGRDGGREGLFEYVKPSWQKRVYPKYSADSPGIAGFGKHIQARPTLQSRLRVTPLARQPRRKTIAATAAIYPPLIVQ